MGIRIAGTGSYLPEKILTNFDLEKMVETSDEWIRTRTGIQERHLASAGQATSDLAFEASQKALEMANVRPEELNAVLVGTVTPDYAFPSTACVLQSRIGAKNAMCFDIEAACSGFLYLMEVAYSLMKGNKKYKYVLISAADKLSCITDWTDRNTCVLFGDGAGAVVLENTFDDTPDFLVESDIHADGTYTEILKMPAGGSRAPASIETVNGHQHFIHMAGKEVFKLAVNAMVAASRKVMEDSHTDPQDIKVVIPHQANERIINAVAPRIGIPPERVYVNVNRCGNTSGASIGICLDEEIRKGTIVRGDLVLATAFGGGLTWGATLIRY